MTYKQRKWWIELVQHFTEYAINNKCVSRAGVPVRNGAAEEMARFGGPNFKIHSKESIIAAMKAANRNAHDTFYNWRGL